MKGIKKVKTAVIGCGAISRIYFENMTNGFEILEVAGWCALNRLLAGDTAAAYDISVLTMEEILEDSGIEIVVNLTNPAAHYGVIRNLLEHGKHVLCEKPIVTAPEQFDELCAFAAEKGLVYMEAIMMRYLPAREILHKAMGQIGRISAARFDFSQLSSRYPALLKGEVPNIFNPAMAAGSLMDLGVYCVYPAIDLFGEPERVRASAGFLSTGADGFGSACLSYPEREVLLSWSKIGQGYAGSEILGDQGSITIQSISMLAGMELHLPDGTRRTLCGVLNKAEAMRGETEAFCRFTQEPGRFWLDAARAVELTSSVCRVMEQIRREAGISFGKLPL